MDVVETAVRDRTRASISAPYRTHEFTALGTQCRLIFEAASDAAANRFTTRAVDWVRSFEARYSRFVPDSLVSRINAAAGKHAVEVDAEFRSLLALCDSFHWITQGVFDPTALPLLDLWDYRGDTPRIPSDAEIEAARNCVGWRRVEHDDRQVFLPDESMRIDIGGIGKEYAVDRIVDMATAAGIRNILVDLGRDVRAQGSPAAGGPWRIGLENPEDRGQCWAGVGIENRALATSGDYARFFEAGDITFGHIIDPRTGRPARHNVRAASVIARTCTEAGILSTTAFIMGPDEGLPLLERSQQVEGVLWSPERCMQTRGFDAYLLGAA